VAKLKVMCARSMHVAVGALGRAFAEQSGHAVEFDFGTVGALQAKLDAGESADVLILSVPAIDKLEQAGLLAPGSRRDVARTFIAVCIRAGAPKPNIATPEAFKQALVKARAIAFSDAAVGGSAGVYLVGMFERMRLAAMIREKGLPQQSGVEVARRVVEGKAELGLTLSGEVASVEGAAIAGPLPAPLGQDTVYCAAVSAASAAKQAAVALIAALTKLETRETWTKAGFEVASKN
jgi:molybdate transport system substrate-binding protein